MERKKIFDILFWIALIVVLMLILWRIFRNSPLDLSIIIGFGLMILFKMWAISDDLKEFKYEVKNSFVRVKRDFEVLKSELKSKRKAG